MKNQNTLAAYILIGLGIYFLFDHLHIPLLNNIDIATASLGIVGLSLLIQNYQTKDPIVLLSGITLFGIAIHLYGLTAHHNIWIDHWAIYMLIIGLALFINFLQTKKGFFVSVIVVGIALLFIFSNKINELFISFFSLFQMESIYWPLVFFAVAIYLLKTKK